VWNVQTNLFFGLDVRGSVNRWSGSVPFGQVSNTSGHKAITFSASRTPLHFFLDLSCHVVCVFSRISLEILAFFAHLFSFHCILFVFLCSFKLLCFLIMENLLFGIFSEDIVHENHKIYVLCWYWYICVVWIAMFTFGNLFLHSINSRHNTIIVLELMRSNISL
jgi:hypothetical protein